MTTTRSAIENPDADRRAWGPDEFEILKPKAAAVRARAESRMWQPEDHPKAKAGTAIGGQFVKAGSSAPAQAAKPAAKPAAAKATPAKATPAKTAPAKKTAAKPATHATHGGHHQPMLEAGRNNDPARVKELQTLLRDLKLGNVGVDGKYGPATEAAVMAAQRKLGMSPTGHASESFLRKLQAAKALSPCLSSKRGAGVSTLELRSDEYRRVVDGPQIRAFDFESTVAGDGRTLEGYAAVYNVRARIRAQGGDFDEEILPKAFARSIAKNTPVMQFEHGMDPRVGRVPIAAIQDLSEDSRGLHVRARLFDNPVVEPVRQAIAEGAIKGMSFRFQVPDGGDNWHRRTGDVDLRQIADADTSELGPVVFPAYDATTVSVRSILAQLGAEERASLVRELAAEVRLAVDLTDLTGRPSTRSAGGGDAPEEDEEEIDDDEELDDEIDEPEPSAPTSRQRLDEGALRVRGILR